MQQRYLSLLTRVTITGFRNFFFLGVVVVTLAFVLIVNFVIPENGESKSNFCYYVEYKGTTIVLATQNMYIADEFFDRIAFINVGRIELIDWPKNLKLKYGEKPVKTEYKEN